MKIILERKYKKADYIIGLLTVEGKDFSCNTLEPADRELTREKGEFYEAFIKRVQAKKAQFAVGTTAIPYGTYDVKMHFSNSFKSYRSYLIGVPGFSGVMIHEGNTKSDTHGCILVGKNTKKGMVQESRATLKTLMDMIYAAEEDREPVEIVIRE